MLIHNFPYSLVRIDKSSKKGGGVCMFILKTLNFKLISSVSVFNTNIVCIDIFEPHELKTVRLIAVYSPPNFKSPENYSTFLNYISELTFVDYASIIIGDFNAPNITWNLEKNLNSKISLVEKQLFDFCFSNNLQQHNLLKTTTIGG
jgi:hypothetical protein